MTSKGRPGRGLLLEAALVALLVMAFYHTHLRLGTMQSGGDAANLFWPIKILIADSLLHDGVIPLWNPWSFMGAPLAASLQHAVYYPPAWVIYAALPAHVGMNLDLLLHLVLAGVGFWFWLRVPMRMPGAAAVCLGALFPCIQWFWGHQEHLNQVATVAWLPWMASAAAMLAAGRLAAAPFTACFSAAGALQFLAGHPQEAFYTHLLCAAIIVAGAARRRAARLLMPWLASLALLGLLVAVQLLPALELSSHSRRQFHDPSYALSYSMPPDVLRLYVSPHAFGSFRDGYWVDAEAGIPDRRAYNEYGLYLGLAPILLALAGVLLPGAGPVRRWRLIMVGGVAGVVLLALGGNASVPRLRSLDFTEFPPPGWSLHELFIRLVPPADGFRVPARIIILSHFLVLTLAAAGIQTLLVRARGRRGAILIAAAIGAVCFGDLYVASRREKFRHPVEVEPMLIQRRLDLASGGAPSLDSRHYRLAIGDDNLLIDERHLATMAAHGNTLLLRFQRLKPHGNAAIQLPLVDGYEEGLVPTARFKDFLYEFHRNLRQFQPDPLLVKLLGVAYLYADPGLPLDEAVYPLDPDRSQEQRRIHRVPFVSGAALMVGEESLGALARLDGPFWRGGAPHPEFSREAVAPPPIRIIEGAPRTEVPTVNSVRVFGLSGEGVPLLALGWYPGWVHEGSGEALEFLSAVHARLEPGSGGQSAIHFHPFSHRAGLFLTAMGAMILAWLLTGIWERRKLSAGAASSPH